MKDKAFLALVEKKKVIYRVNDAGLATIIACSEKTFKRRKKHPEEFTLGEINRIMSFLKFTDEERREALI